jgi:hypothetical protein
LVVVAKELVQEIYGFVGDVPLVLGSDESSPRFPWIPAWPNKLKGNTILFLLYSPSQDVVILRIKLNVILFKVCV